jgi:hypothetical protein
MTMINRVSIGILNPPIVIYVKFKITVANISVILAKMAKVIRWEKHRKRSS